jgi:hypothetical protein
VKIENQAGKNPLLTVAYSLEQLIIHTVTRCPANQHSVTGSNAHVQQPVDTVQMAMLPTPITPFQLSELPPGVCLHLKRDDLTGMQMSGNKVWPSPVACM